MTMTTSQWLLCVFLGTAISFLNAQEPAAPAPSPIATVATPAASPTATPAVKADIKRTPKGIELYSLAYDEDADVFSGPTTKRPYSGPVYSKYDDGVVESEGTLKNGHEQGWWIEYFEDGTKDNEGAYDKGEETGYWKYWHENGQLASGGNFKEGSPDGPWITFYENGKIESQGLYIDGLMDGAWKFFNERTGEATIFTYDKGIQLKQ